MRDVSTSDNNRTPDLALGIVSSKQTLNNLVDTLKKGMYSTSSRKSPVDIDLLREVSIENPLGELSIAESAF